MRQKQEEEERRRLQEAAMLKKQQEEEERRQQEEAERRRKEQEELRKVGWRKITTGLSFAMCGSLDYFPRKCDLVSMDIRRTQRVQCRYDIMIVKPIILLLQVAFKRKIQLL